MLQIQCLQSKELETNSLFSRLAIGPLQKGQGLTLGNALRRVLLADLPGIAIVGVRIADINHEFSMIKGVKEDVINILLNLKQIVLNGDIEDSLLVRLDFQGPGIVTAKDINLPDEIKLIEPNQYIATVIDSNVLEMEIIIQAGKGYVLNTKVVNLSDEFLAIDAVFMPVIKVNFFVETSNQESLSNLESLILEISTNGSLTPSEALNNAAEILRNLFASLTSTKAPRSEEPQQQQLAPDSEESTSKIENTLIDELELSVRAFNCLKRANIHTLGDLLKYSQEDLLEFKNFGRKSAEEVCLSLQTKFGKTLGPQ